MSRIAVNKLANRLKTKEINVDSLIDSSLRSLKPSSVLPSVRDNGTPLEVGDTITSLSDGLEYKYTGTGWVTTDISDLLKGNSSGKIGYSFPQANSTPRTVQSRLEEKVSIFDLVPVSQHAGIKAGTSTYDASPDIAKGVAWGVSEIDFGGLNNVINMNSQVTLTKGIYLKGNATIKVGATNRAFLFNPGFSIQMPILSIGALTNYPAFGGNAVTPLNVTSSSGISRGDVVLVTSEDVYSFSTSARKGELIRVLEVVGNTIYLHGFLSDTYTTNAKLTKLKKEKFIINGLKFTSQADPYTQSAGSGLGVLRLQGAVDADINAEFTNLGSAGLNLTSCWATEASVRVSDLRDKLSINSYGYGVIAYGATRHSRLKINAQRVRHAYTGGVIDSFQSILDYGTARNNTIYDSLSLNATAASFDTHPGEYDAEFRDCRSIFRNGDADSSTSQAPGYQDRGCDTRFINCGTEGVAVGWELLGAQQLHGKENITELHNCWTKTLDRLASPAVFTIRTKTAPELCYIRVFGGSYNGGIKGGILSIEDNSPIMEWRGVEFYDISTMRMGAGNTISMTKCDRINRAPSIEPIILGDGTSISIDNYFADAPSYSNNQLIRSGLSTATGNSIVNAGRITATNRNTSVHPIGTNSVSGGTATVTINRIDAYPLRSRISNTSSRPILTAADIGYIYFDSSLNKPIFFNGTSWVDTTGTSV